MIHRNNEYSHTTLTCDIKFYVINLHYIIFSYFLYLDVSLLSLGTILQRSNYLNDSLIVIESAVNHAPHVTENLWNLCNNYLLLSQFEKSFECFQKVESQDAAYSARIDYIKNSFRCFRDLKVTLLAMENTVNEIPSELILYRELKKELEEIHEKLEKEQVT